MECSSSVGRTETVAKEGAGAGTRRRMLNVLASGASATTIANVSVSEGAGRLGTRPLSVESVYASQARFQYSNCTCSRLVRRIDVYVVDISLFKLRCDLRITDNEPHPRLQCLICAPTLQSGSSTHAAAACMITGLFTSTVWRAAPRLLHRRLERREVARIQVHDEYYYPCACLSLGLGLLLLSWTS